MIGPDALRTLRKDVENALLLADLVEENDQAQVLYVVDTKPEASDESTCNQPSEESGSDRSQTDHQPQAALLRNSSWSTTQKTNSLCCTAAGITALPSSTIEAPVPQEKLREAATHDATLIAQNRPPAQPVVGGTPYVIVDICLRMLKPPELYKAQGFPADYVITHGADGKPFTKTQQVHMCGNSVSPPPMAALAKANDPWRQIELCREAA
ncbi:DNA cytosine methyltransferase [Pseudomonas syringae group genomosp. 3]|nr:DNA cytosine methyltransferase [Pseudomonas syringae group genomosp. 3]